MVNSFFIVVSEDKQKMLSLIRENDKRRTFEPPVSQDLSFVSVTVNMLLFKLCHMLNKEKKDHFNTVFMIVFINTILPLFKIL